MPKRPSGPVRRGQLIAPFGVGSLIIVPGGTSLIIGGLDYWFQSKDEKRKISVEEFRVYEWRLQRLLDVSHFRLPPDYRDSYKSQGFINAGLTIPAFRFPTWHFCPDKDCRLLRRFPMYARGKGGRLKCPACEKKKRTRYMFQVPFVAMCSDGHIQDFPWREWVHGESNPLCQKDLHLISTGMATLAGQRVACDCGAERTLAGITTAYPNGTTLLSKSLCNDGDAFLCQGRKSWLGEDEQEQCSSQLRGSLRSASNLYFAQVLSSIYLPITEDPNLQRLEHILQNDPVSTLLSILGDIGASTFEQKAQAIRRSYARIVVDFTDSQIVLALKKLSSDQDTSFGYSDIAEDSRTSFRRAEYSVLGSERNDEFLKIKQGSLSDYQHDLSRYFSKLMLVKKLRETRVLTGFTRVFAENDQDRNKRQNMLWKEVPDFSERWLPAYTVFGEGIFFEFSEELLREWEAQKELVKRIAPLIKRNKDVQEKRHVSGPEISARYVLLHTFSHLVMNRLTFECGYSSAALRERIYVSTHPKFPMAGVLIYTADGDSEGTMGGLVRIGKPGNIEPVLSRALENAKWCSSDPVCMELGSTSGQGPDSCNLAACHNCSLVPETACEDFNRFLDRGVIVGDFENSVSGYFTL